jgi:protocatechuate 3,4-dioxygenase, beta subunit
MNRRKLLLATLAATALAPGGAMAALAPTPRQSRGPFYPDRLPLDSDNDLVRVEGRQGLALGEITHLTGRVLDRSGRPLSGALVEIWQCDAHGRYLHSADTGGALRDPGFQGYGRFETAADGAYRFRTIKPVPYPGRAPHIHVSVRLAGQPPLVTQLYAEGARENAGDWLLNDAEDPAALIVHFEPIQAADASLAARFDLVLPTG